MAISGKRHPVRRAGAQKKQTVKKRISRPAAPKKSRVLVDIPHPATSPGSLRKPARSEVRKHLDERLRALYRRAMVIERELDTLDKDRFYRCCIFGSARIKPETQGYQDVFNLGRFLSWQGIDILTGGGPGLMEAANKGAKLGQQEKRTKTLSFGLSIELEWEPTPNKHLDVKRHHHKFSSRLDDFMRLANSIIVTPGGIGTLLELFFSWQLIQVKHIASRPIVLMDKLYWTGVIDWMKTHTLERGLINAADFDYISIVDTPEQAVEIIGNHHREFRTRVLNAKGSEG